MKKSLIIAITSVVFFVVGGLIVGWAVYQKGDLVYQEGGLQKSKAAVKSFTDDNFEKEVVEASKRHPILVDFYAEWCYPCKMLDPILQELANDLHGRATIGKLDTDKNLIARRFGISRIPAMFIIRDGEIKDSFYGVIPKATLVKALEQYGS